MAPEIYSVTSIEVEQVEKKTFPMLLKFINNVLVREKGPGLNCTYQALDLLSRGTKNMLDVGT